MAELIAGGSIKVDVSLLQTGSHALFASTTEKLKAALGDANELPKVGICFQSLSISANLPVVNAASSQSLELPMLINAVKQSFRGLRAEKHFEKQFILKDVSGTFKAASVTLVLGRPGFGKSSLMKVLSGRFPVDKNVTIDGEITLNGRSIADEHLAKRVPQLVGYLTQRDTHHASLTVNETLKFAHACCSDGLGKALKAMDTVVGNAMLRGISGGEKKRVTTGEMLFGMKLALLMDDISMGLDSAATFDIVSSMHSAAKTLGSTVVISLLQPSPEVLALFDDVLILSDGEVIYHGAQDQVMTYFAGLGFSCPSDRDAADFLLDIGTAA